MISVSLVLQYTGPLPKSPLVSLLTYQFLICIGKPIEFHLMDLVGTFSAISHVIVLVSVST